MIVDCVPNPFPPMAGFRILVMDGVPPFTFEPKPSPPNPPGVIVTPTGDVIVPPATPPGTDVEVDVTDSSIPPQTVTAKDTTA